MALLAGRTAIVTAASSGIGHGIVERFVQEGANVIAVSRDIESLTRSLSAFPQGQTVPVAGSASDERTAGSSGRPRR
jgi:NAD(P)-dependent dehydrogenase (short-subunit alcohol dehydrogenase family)